MPRFHEHLYQLVLRENPIVMVETGYASGLSAMHILAAMDINCIGTLYSVECFTNQDIFHPRLKYVHGMSQDKLPEIYRQSGPWDIFLHDSDHEFGCTTFEYELAWRFLKPGGLLISDDYEWGNPPHHSWKQFLDSKPHEDLTTIGCAQFCRKPKNEPAPQTSSAWISWQKETVQVATNSICKRNGVAPYCT